MKNVKQDQFLRLDSNLFGYSVNGTNVTLDEYYAIKGGPIIIENVGVWTMERGLEIPVLYMWSRRTDLRGMTLTNAVLEWNPFNFLQGDGIHWAGMFIDILSALQKTLNFQVNYAQIIYKMHKY